MYCDTPSSTASCFSHDTVVSCNTPTSQLNPSYVTIQSFSYKTTIFQNIILGSSPFQFQPNFYFFRFAITFLFFFFFFIFPATRKHNFFLYTISFFPEYSNKFIKIHFTPFSSILQLVKSWKIISFTSLTK